MVKMNWDFVAILKFSKSGNKSASVGPRCKGSEGEGHQFIAGSPIETPPHREWSL